MGLRARRRLCLLPWTPPPLLHLVPALGPQALPSTSVTACGTARRHPWLLAKQGLLMAIRTSASDPQPCPPEVVAALRGAPGGRGSISLSPLMRQLPPSPTEARCGRGAPTAPVTCPDRLCGKLQSPSWLGPFVCGRPLCLCPPSKQSKQHLSSPAQLHAAVAGPWQDGGHLLVTLGSQASLHRGCSGFENMHGPDFQQPARCSAPSSRPQVQDKSYKTVCSQPSLPRAKGQRLTYEGKQGWFPAPAF